MKIIDILNNNQGVLSALGVCFVIPLAIWSNAIIAFFKKKEYRNSLQILLLDELWQNMLSINQIVSCYEQNLTDEDIHIPYFGPRISIIEKYFNFEIAESLPYKEKKILTEVYGQLKEFRDEYYRWHDLIFKTSVTSDKELYRFVSVPLMGYIEPLMRNILTLWVFPLKDLGSKSSFAEIRELNMVISKKIKKGKVIRGSYKSSFLSKDCNNINNFDIILCWENDWPETTKEVIEIKQYLKQGGKV